MKATVLSLLSCIFVMLFTQRFRLYMFCLFPLSEPYNPPSWWTICFSTCDDCIWTRKRSNLFRPRTHIYHGFAISYLKQLCLIFFKLNKLHCKSLTKDLLLWVWYFGQVFNRMLSLWLGLPFLFITVGSRRLNLVWRRRNDILTYFHSLFNSMNVIDVASRRSTHRHLTCGVAML